MLEVQKYLLNGAQHATAMELLEMLKENYGIDYKVYLEDDMVLLDYNQINHGLLGHKAHPIVIECRSLILRLSDFEILSRKFKRFFNAGEVPEYYSDFSFDNAMAFSKEDGSLIGLYYNAHTKLWEVSTRGMAKAEGVHQCGKSFRELFLESIGIDNEKQLQYFANTYFNKSYTLVFELINTINRIVTPYSENCVYLLAIVNNETGVEEPWNVVEYAQHILDDRGLNVKIPLVHEIKSVDEAIKKANNLPNLQEGFVIFDPVSQKRMKVKSTNYLVAHKMRGETAVPTKRNLLTAFFDGDLDELISYFPEFKKYADPFIAEYHALLDEASAAWHKYKHIDDQKEFAMHVKNHPRVSGLLFGAKRNQMTPTQIFNDLDLNKKLRFFGV
jgi:hypothetical protein